MRVGELIDLLSKCPRNDLLIIDTDTEDINIDADITDVLVGNGTLKGFSFIKMDRANEIIVDAPTAYDADKVVRKLEDKISALEKLDTSEEIVDVAIKELQWAIDVIKAEKKE